MHNAGLTGAAAAVGADPDGDGAANLLEHGAGTNPSQGGSAPARPIIGTSGPAPDGPRPTLTVNLAKPLPADILVTCEFSEDLGLTDPWSPTGMQMADEDMGSYIKRVFTAPHVIGQPPSGFMRAKVSQQ